MKELYTTPEAVLIGFAAAEKIASNGITSAFDARVSLQGGPGDSVTPSDGDIDT